MLLYIILFFIVIILLYYLYCYIQVHEKFNKKGVKYVRGIPIFASIFKNPFLKNHSLRELEQIYNTYPDEKYVGFIEFMKPVLLIRDPELIKNITVKDFDHFVDHKQFFTKDVDPFFGNCLFLMKGDKWRDMRTTLSPAFTSSKMKYVMPYMQEVATNVIEYLKEHTSKDVDANDLIRRYTNDVILSAGFGLQVNSLKDRDNEFYKIGNEVFDFNVKQRTNFITHTEFPRIAKMIGSRVFSDHIYTFFTKLVATVIDQRKRENVERPDMIQLLMKTTKDWTVNELTAQVFLFFAAGFDTSASAIAMSIHELALNPEVQEKLYQEIRKYSDEKDFKFDSLSELKYLECVINESLRKWSPAIFTDRICVKPYTLPPPREGGRPYLLKPGDIVLNMVNCLHMDPKYFPEPETFDPERFSEENKRKIQPFTFLPFGIGPRICIGTRFAYMEIKVLLYQLILNFKIMKCEKTTDPIQLESHTFNLKSFGGFWLRLEKRNE